MNKRRRNPDIQIQQALRDYEAGIINSSMMSSILLRNPYYYIELVKIVSVLDSVLVTVPLNLDNPDDSVFGAWDLDKKILDYVLMHSPADQISDGEGLIPISGLPEVAEILQQANLANVSHFLAVSLHGEVTVYLYYFSSDLDVVRTTLQNLRNFLGHAPIHLNCEEIPLDVNLDELLPFQVCFRRHWLPVIENYHQATFLGVSMANMISAIVPRILSQLDLYPAATPSFNFLRRLMGSSSWRIGVVTYPDINNLPILWDSSDQADYWVDDPTQKLDLTENIWFVVELLRNATWPRSPIRFERLEGLEPSSSHRHVDRTENIYFLVNGGFLRGITRDIAPEWTGPWGNSFYSLLRDNLNRPNLIIQYFPNWVAEELRGRMASS